VKKGFEDASVIPPWVVLGELHYGDARAQRRAEQLANIRELLRVATLLLPDRNTAQCYGEVKAELAQAGKPIPDNDIWIASVARQYELPLATRDAHFRFISRLTTLGW